MLPLTTVLFPDPPRTIPAHRALSIALRTAHLGAFGTLLGGHVFNVDHLRLLPFLYATIITGVALMGLELAATCAWLFMGKGVAVVAKLGLLAMIPLFWEQRVWILLGVLIVASVASHMPSRFRHCSLLPAGGAAKAACDHTPRFIVPRCASLPASGSSADARDELPRQLPRDRMARKAEAAGQEPVARHVVSEK